MASRVGRPTKYTDEIAYRIRTHISYGAPVAYAAKTEGVHPDTVYEWMHRHPAFSDMVERARGQAITDNLRRLNVAANRGSVPAATWLLERLAPEHFAEPPKKVQHSGPEGGPVQTEVKHTVGDLPEHLQALLNDANETDGNSNPNSPSGS